MRKSILFLMVIALNGSAAECPFETFNDSGYGTIKLRAQTLSMHRDYEGVSGAPNVGSGYSTTLGWKLDYLTPEWGSFSAGASYIHVDELHAAGGRYGSDGEALLSNGRVNELNELWVKYTMDAVGLTNTYLKVGRQVLNTEVLRSDEFRQKPRAFEAAVLVSKDISNTTLIIGHAERMSNVWDNDSSWKYQDIEDALGVGYKTDGITWAEIVNTSISNLEVAVYDAYAHDISNIAGGRFKYSLSDKTAVNGYYRHESDVGDGAKRTSDLFGASIQQKVGSVTLEPGFLSIAGDSLVFSEAGTGINHPLGSSMMIYSGIWNGGADSYYLKATTRVDDTILYALYNYTTHDTSSYEGQELNFVAKQLVNDRLSVALKLGVGYRDGKGFGEDTTATDARLFVTYQF